MLHDQFKNEAEFRSNFVRPLLTRLGYVGIAELHGAQEFGKDFVFAELTSFGFLKYHAAVVKHEASINQGAGILQDVLRQIQEAFAVRFKISDSPDEHSVSSVYVFNSGKITENAKTYFRSELDRRDYGANVHILDSERLHQLDLTASVQEQRQYLPRLRGLIAAVFWNRTICEIANDDLSSGKPHSGMLTQPIEDFLASPFLLPQLNLIEFFQLLEDCRRIDWSNSRLFLIKLGEQFGHVELMAPHLASYREQLEKCKKRCDSLMPVLNNLASQFVPLAPQQAAVIPTPPTTDTTTA